MNKLLLIALIGLSLSQCSTPPDNELATNKELVRYFIEEMLAKGDLSEYKERRTKDFVCHSPDGDFGLEEDYQNALKVQGQMKGFKIHLLRLIAEEDFVVAHWQAENENEIGTGVIIFRISNGLLAEEWPSMPYFERKGS